MGRYEEEGTERRERDTERRGRKEGGKTRRWERAQDGQTGERRETTQT